MVFSRSDPCVWFEGAVLRTKAYDKQDPDHRSDAISFEARMPMNEIRAPVQGLEPPLISVIVVFHTRLVYLPNAIASVVAQTLDSLKFEILVVGPRRPAGLVDRSESPRLTFVECTEVSLGSKLAAAIRKAKGGILTFLEDDDLYRPDRLEVVLESFRSSPSLTYLQNGYTTIDAEGRMYPWHGPYERRMARWMERGPIEVPGRARSRELRKLAHIPAGFNNSSIAVRRALLSPALDLLSAVNTLVDVTLLYIALSSPGRLRLDPRQLTEVRKHRENTADPQFMGRSEQLARLLSFQLETQALRQPLTDYVESTGPVDLTRSLEGQRAIADLILSLRDPDAQISRRAGALLRCVERLDTFEVRNYLPAVPLGFLLLFTGRRGPDLYIYFRRWFYGQPS